jgi:glyceraldehyde 3-phosphate dehydrogenase
MIRVGINGLGRIGRALLRNMLKQGMCKVTAVNDINPDIENLAYLIKYDSTYGRLDNTVVVKGDTIVIDDFHPIRITQNPDIHGVDWDADLVVDASGVTKNLINARELKKQGVKWCIVTNSPEASMVDKTIIMGVNEDTINPGVDFLLSSSICDANAFVPVMHTLDQHLEIDHGFLTTLHPWLSYQNLLDGPSISYATPGEIYDHYALGRSSIGALIPKTTSAISASCKVLTNLTGKFMSVSFRIPTAIVSCGDVSVKFKKKTSAEEIKRILFDQERKQKLKIIHNNGEALVSADYAGFDYSASVDHRWIMVNDENYAKLVLWYDNEWGYSARVYDLVNYLESVSGLGKK